MTPSEKQPKPSLLNLCMREDLRSGGPSVDGLIIIVDRLTKGERFEGAVDMVASHGTPQMMAALHEVGLVTAAQWQTWKARLSPSDAALALEWPDEWPHEIREWAAVVAVAAH